MSHTLLQTIDWAQSFVNYLPLTVGTGNNPALTNANNILQLFLSPDVMTWSWNRGTTSFQTVIGQQDYVVNITNASVPTFGYLETASLQPCAAITNVAGSGTVATITAPNAFSAGSTVTITGLTHTAFNVTNAPILTATATQFTFASSTSQSSTADTGLAVSGTIFQIKDIKNSEPLSKSSDGARPNSIAVQYDDGAGNITFRFMSVPNATFLCVLDFQQAAVPFTTTSSTWGTIPDKYAYIYNRGFLAETLEPVDAQRAQTEKQRFILSLVSIAEGLEMQDKAIFVAQYLNIDAQTAASMLDTQQGVSAKASR
jgi:hypothetical protein